MKRKLLLCVAVCATISVFPQNSKMKPSPTGKENLKPLLKAEVNENPVSPVNTLTKSKISTVNPAPQQNSASKTSAVNTWTNISTSMNIYGVLISYCKPLQYNDELNAVSFIHRKPGSYIASPLPAATAASGLMVAAVSGDFGTNWDTTLIWNDNTNWARYPGGAIYNPAGNTALSSAYVVGAGPTTSAAGGWPGNFYASKSLATFNNIASTAPNAQQWMDITNPNPNVGRHDFAAYGYNATDDGKMRNLAGVTDDGTGADTAFMLITGSFNSGVFAYTGTRFNPPSTVDGVGDDNWLSRPAMAWNEAGTVGYVAVMGQRMGATGRNTGLQPMVWKTTNSGASWASVAAIDFNNAAAYGDITYHMTSQGSSTLEVPNFLWTEGFDMAVDANNKLHLFTVLVGHYSVDPDSLNYTSGFNNYKWPHTPGLRPYLYDFMTDGSSAWTYNTVDSMSSEGASDLPAGNGFSENPWTLNGANKVRLDARLQMSRTPNGKYLFYSWGESDTNFTSSAKKYNVLPNIKVRAYGVDENLVSLNEVNVSSPSSGANPNVASKAFYHFMSPKTSSAVVVVVSPTLTTISAKTPFTISNSPGFDQLNSNTHWYNTSQSSFTFSPKGVSVAENALNSANTSFIYPNPAADNAALSIELINNDKVELNVFNLMGQSVMAYTVDGQAGQNIINMDVTALKSGIYMINVKVGNASSTKKLIVE